MNSFGTRSTKIRGSDGRDMRQLFDPEGDNFLVEAPALARSCQDTSRPWILRKKADCPKFVSGRSVAQYCCESGKNGSRD